MGGLLWTLISAVGLGSVLLTRFGTQRYAGSSKSNAGQAEPGLPEVVPADDLPGDESPADEPAADGDETN